MGDVDFDELRELVKRAVRGFVHDVGTKYGKDDFYALALEVMDDADGIYAAANSRQGLAWGKSKFAEDPSDEPMVKWDTAHWRYRWEEANHFHPIYAHLEALCSQVSEEEWPAYRDGVLATAVQSLRELRDEGVLQALGKELTLFITIPGGEDEYLLLENESSSSLNSPHLHALFMGRYPHLRFEGNEIVVLDEESD